MFCKVLGCRFSGAHTTAGHKCGRCNEYGHGVLECRFAGKKEELKQYFEEEMPSELQCTFPGCKYKWSHSTGSHNCHKCFRNHKSESCIIKPISDYFTLFPDINEIFGDNDFCYIKRCVNNNDAYYIRSVNKEVEVLWMAFYAFNDNSQLLRRFIAGLKEITTSKKCPICRCINDKDTIFDIKGSTDKCSVCLENEVEKFFSDCGHACVCNNCYKQLN